MLVLGNSNTTGNYCILFINLIDGRSFLLHFITIFTYLTDNDIVSHCFT